MRWGTTSFGLLLRIENTAMPSALLRSLWIYWLIVGMRKERLDIFTPFVYYYLMMMMISFNFLLSLVFWNNCSGVN